METAAKTTRYVVRLRSRQEVAERTFAFRFEKPAGFRFKPGQYLTLTPVHPTETDPQGNSRDLSIASAPHEEHLMVATRLRGSVFKRGLVSAPLDSEFNIDGPFGGFTLHNNVANAAILLAGGIGITPFRSMVLRAARDRSAHRIVLFYSNHRPEDAPFLEELQSLEKENANYRFVGVMTAMERSARVWNGERGRLSRELLARHLETAASPIFYIAGPPSLVSGVQVLLHEIGFDDDNIRAEEFAGY